METVTLKKVGENIFIDDKPTSEKMITNLIQLKNKKLIDSISFLQMIISFGLPIDLHPKDENEYIFPTTPLSKDTFTDTVKLSYPIDLEKISEESIKHIRKATHCILSEKIDIIKESIYHRNIEGDGMSGSCYSYPELILKVNYKTLISKRQSIKESFNFLKDRTVLRLFINEINSNKNRILKLKLRTQTDHCSAEILKLQDCNTQYLLILESIFRKIKLADNDFYIFSAFKENDEKWIAYFNLIDLSIGFTQFEKLKNENRSLQ